MVGIEALGLLALYAPVQEPLIHRCNEMVLPILEVLRIVG